MISFQEIDNLQLTKIVSQHLNKKLKYKFVGFHSSCPSHDLRYAISGKKLEKIGWNPKKNIKERVKEAVSWSLKNKEWL